jgi:hypothetical protein
MDVQTGGGGEKDTRKANKCRKAKQNGQHDHGTGCFRFVSFPSLPPEKNRFINQIRVAQGGGCRQRRAKTQKRLEKERPHNVTAPLCCFPQPLVAATRPVVRLALLFLLCVYVHDYLNLPTLLFAVAAAVIMLSIDFFLVLNPQCAPDSSPLLSLSPSCATRINRPFRLFPHLVLQAS